VLLRVPRRMECPSFDVSRVTAVLVPKPGDPVQTAGPCVLEEAPVSVDPIAQTEQLALLFPAQTKLGEFSHVELTIDGQKRKFCLDSSSTCKDDSLVLRCVVCKSADTRPYTHIPPTFTDRPCGFTPDPPPVPEQTDKEYPFQHHCNTCSFDF